MRFFYIAKGSLAELRTQPQIAYEVGYLEAKFFLALDKECEDLGKMVGKLIKVRAQIIDS